MYMRASVSGYVISHRGQKKGVRSSGTGTTSRWLLAKLWVLRIEPKSSGRLAGAFNHSIIYLALITQVLTSIMSQYIKQNE